MRLLACEIEGYRSLKSTHLALGSVTVLIGQNGVGKTNLLNGIELIQAAALGTICRRLAEEGGLESAIWAGRPEGPLDAPSSIRLTAEFKSLRYTIEVGAPGPEDAALSGEPIVREEALYRTQIGSDGTGEQTIMHREGTSVLLRDARGARQHFREHLMPSETALSAFRDGAAYPELAYLRQLLETWRIYHRFSLDAAAPSRRPSLALCTPALAPDGRDLAAALATIAQLKRRPDLINGPIGEAFPGASLDITVHGGNAHLGLSLPDVARPMPAAQMSEGALQIVSLIAALTAFRPPGLIAINEPEAGIHESLLGLVARLVVRAAEHSQICIVTQSSALAEAIAALSPEATTIEVTRRDAATVLVERHQPEPAMDDDPGPAAEAPVDAPVPVALHDIAADRPAADDVVVVVALDTIPAPPDAPPPPGGLPETVAERLESGTRELAQLGEARKALAEIQDLVATLDRDPSRLAELTADIRTRLDRLKEAQALLPPEIGALTMRLERELLADPTLAVPRLRVAG